MKIWLSREGKRSPTIGRIIFSPSMKTRFATLLAVLMITAACCAAQRLIPGAECTQDYLPLLSGKRVALLINQTSRIGPRLLADSLLRRGVRLTKIFVPEHGFRGTGDAGAHIANGKDSATGLPLISLYGKAKKPTAQQLEGVDVVVYDIQDVGARFYTYISTLQYMMEACAENGKRLIILDRPNPNGHYVDGPVLDTALRSFVGMQPVPIVYGMTPGEYALMLIGERWFRGAASLRIDVIRCKGYDHKTRYTLPVAPSPNLRAPEAVALYPTLCLFEGTTISVGRGTDKPFQQWGHPALEGAFTDSFRPASTIGATKPPFEGQACYGRVATAEDVRAASAGIRVEWVVEMWSAMKTAGKPFWTENGFFEKLYGRKDFAESLSRGRTSADIRAAWQPGLRAFRAIRKKYLLYKDF